MPAVKLMVSLIWRTTNVQMEPFSSHGPKNHRLGTSQFQTPTQSHIIDTVSTVHSRPVGRQLINLHIDADPIVMRTQVTIIRQLCQVRRCLPASTFQSLVQTLYFTAGLLQRRHDRPPCLSDAAATVGFQFGCEADLWTSAV